MPRNQRDSTFDLNLLLQDAVAQAAAGPTASTVGGVASVLDFGAGLAAAVTGQRVDGRLILDVSAIDVAGGDEGYTIQVQLSNSATFATGNFMAFWMVYGDSTIALETVDTAVPRHQEFGFTNEINGVRYRYCRLLLTEVGATHTITYTAFLALD